MYGGMVGDSRGRKHGLRRDRLLRLGLPGEHEVGDTPVEMRRGQGCWVGVSSEVYLRRRSCVLIYCVTSICFVLVFVFPLRYFTSGPANEGVTTLGQ